MAASAVAVTGSSGYIGAALIHKLEEQDWVENILAIDIRPPHQSFSSKVTFVKQNVRSSMSDLFRKHSIDTVVHLAFVLKPGHNEREIRAVNVEGTHQLLQSSIAADVQQIVYLSSSTIYGAHPDNPSQLIEDSPIRPIEGFQYSQDKALTDKIVREFAMAHPDIKTVVLRGCPVLGPNADNFVSRAFSKPLLIGLSGFDPPLQLLHEEDLTETIAYSIQHDVSGVYNIAGNDVIRWSEMGHILQRKMLKLPATILTTITEITWKLRLQSESPGAGLVFIQYPWSVSTEKIQTELGISFKFSARDTWMAFANRFTHTPTPL